MKTLHLKSPCCQENIQHFGGKRRKCAGCGRTWTVRPKRRGRKSIRRFKNPVVEIFGQGTTLTAWAKHHQLTVSNASRQFQRSLTKFLNKSAKLVMPPGPYVLLVDGLWFIFKKQKWAMFLLALKPVSKNKAYFLDPVLLVGGESYENWTMALATIPTGLKKQVKAMISDGFRSSRAIAFEQGWVHQRCHFHLIAYLQVRRGKRKKGLKGATIREAIYQTVLKLLTAKSRARVKALSAHLKLLAKKVDCPKSMQMAASEFLRALAEFRAYLHHKDFHLPTTTGSVETMGKLIRKRTGTIRTAKSLKLWATALVRLKSPITCNGKNIQQN